MSTSQILQFYENANVFITGGTGFLGKILIEKLLRTTSVSTVYLLIRPKKGKDLESRIRALLEDTVFEKLQKECPKFIHRVVGIKGDVSLPGLGISELDRQMLIDKIDLIFHAAATMRFDENLKIAFCVNVNGAREMIELASQIKNLKALMHVSTAFSNCHLEEIDEKFYDYGLDHKKIGMILDRLSESEAHAATPKIIKGWPNTYCFTKAMAESTIRDLGDSVPIGVFRPSIVISTYKEPTEGWIDNLYGPTGVCAGTNSGLLRVIFCDKDKKADLVPVDMCVSALLVSAWDTSQRTKHESNHEEKPIYNYVSGENSFTWREFCMVNEMYSRRYPLMRSIWSQLLYLTNNPIMHLMMKILFHFIPALIIDFVSLIFFKNMRMMAMYKKIHKFADVLAFFSSREWRFHNDNVVKLWSKLENEDRKLFFFDMATLDWWDYYKNYILGMRKYIMKESMDTLESARRKKLVFDILHSIFLALIYFTLSIVMWTFLQRIFFHPTC